MLLIGQLEDLEPFMEASDEVQQEMTWCWDNSFHVSLSDSDTAEMHVNNSCDRHQVSLMAWLYDGAVGMSIVNNSFYFQVLDKWWMKVAP